MEKSSKEKQTENLQFIFQMDIFDIHMWRSNIIIIHRLFETLSISNFWWPILIQNELS